MIYDSAYVKRQRWLPVEPESLLSLQRERETSISLVMRDEDNVWDTGHKR